MKRILSSLALGFMVAFMLTACGSSDDNKPALYELFDSYDYTTFPESTPWSYYTRTSAPDIWIDALTIPNNWSIGGEQVSLGMGLGTTQNSAFINNNYSSSASCSVSAKMTMNNDTNGNLGLILRATGSGSEHYAFVYKVVTSVPTVEIQKVDAAGTITPLGTAPVANSSVTPFDPSALHTYRFSVSGTSTLTFTASIDGVQQLPAVTNAGGTTVTPASDPITDDGTVLHGNGLPPYPSGKTGFFLGDAHTGGVSRYFIWEP